jgi:hypothetical protein
MDKIPAALQHKIDYINALDIPDKSKVSRITIATLDYQAYCRARSLTEKSSVSLKGTVLESLATLLDKYNEDAAKKWERFEDKGLQPAENPPPMPPVMPPKQVINEDITLANKGNNLGYNADSLGLVLGSKPSRINEDEALPPELSVSSVPVPPKRVINQDITLTNKGNVMGGGGGSGFCSEGGKGGSGFKASKADVDAQRIKDNDESMRRFYAMWSSL